MKTNCAFFVAAGIVLIGLAPSAMPACYPESKVFLCMVAGLASMAAGLILLYREI